MMTNLKDGIKKKAAKYANQFDLTKSNALQLSAHNSNPYLLNLKKA